MTATVHFKKPLAILALLVPLLYVAVLSFSVCNNWFVVDDRQEVFFVRENESFLHLFRFDVFGLFRPVKNLLFLVFTKMEGSGVRWCHVLAIAIGAGSFFPVSVLCRRIFNSEWKGLVAASVWLFSPTLVSSSAWLSCLNIRIMVIFAALAMVFHDSAWGGEAFRPKRIVLAGIFLFLALISYECALAVVPILLLFDLILRPKRLATRDAKTAHLAYWSITALYLTLRTMASAKFVAEGVWAEAARWQLAVTSPYFTAQHFASWFWPFGRFTVLGGYRWGDVSIWILACCAALGITTILLAILLCKRLPVLSFCLFFALLGFAPVSNCLGSGNGPYGDYYLTLASIGLAAGCVEIASLLTCARGRWRVPALLVVALFALTRIAAIGESARWARLWSDGIAAYEESCRNFPDIVSNRLLVIEYVSNEGRYEEAMELGRQIQAALPPGSPKMDVVYRVRSLYALNVEKDAEKAFFLLDRCMELAPTIVATNLVHYYRGCVYDDLTDDVAAAEREYEAALSDGVNFKLVPCADRLARLKAIRGERDAAINLWEIAERGDPDNVAVLWNLCVAYREEGNKERVQELWKRVQKLTGQSGFPFGGGAAVPMPIAESTDSASQSNSSNHSTLR